MVVYFLGGGVGVGWTYLALVVAIGHGFKHHPLARSAIGPSAFPLARRPFTSSLRIWPSAHGT